MPWWLAAILSAIFAGAVGVLAKLGFGNEANKISSNLGTALRLLVILPMAWLIVTAEGSWGQIGRITNRQWLFLVLSAVATGLSWLFYFVAINKGDVTRVNPIDKASLAVGFVLAVIFLGEKMTWQNTTASILVLVALFVVLIKPSDKGSAALPASGVASTKITTNTSASAGGRAAPQESTTEKPQP